MYGPGPAGFVVALLTHAAINSSARSAEAKRIEEEADELAALTGLARERFHLVDGELLSWHGSRTPRGIDYAESVIGAGREPAG